MRRPQNTLLTHLPQKRGNPLLGQRQQKRLCQHDRKRTFLLHHPPLHDLTVPPHGHPTIQKRVPHPLSSRPGDNKVRLLCPSRTPSFSRSASLRSGKTSASTP